MAKLTLEQAFRIAAEREQRTGNKAAGDRARGQRSRDLTGSDGTRDLEPGNNGRNVRASRPQQAVSRQVSRSRSVTVSRGVTASQLVCTGCQQELCLIDGPEMGWTREGRRPVKIRAHQDGSPVCDGATVINLIHDMPHVRESAPSDRARTSAAERDYRRREARVLRDDKIAARDQARGVGMVVIAMDQKSRRDGADV